MDRSSKSVLDALDLSSLFFSIAEHTSPLAIRATTSSIPFQTETMTDMVIKDFVFFISWYIKNKHCIPVSFTIVKSGEGYAVVPKKSSLQYSSLYISIFFV